jgi:predicted Zn-dependent peptidase
MPTTATATDLELDLRRHTLDNGLRVVLQRDDRLPLVAVNVWYHVGSKNERPGRTGFAHLFEHMLFQGSEHVGTNDHFRYVQQAGGTANGSTWYDRTNYYETLPAHYLDLGLWLESDRMGWLLPAMTQAKLDTQREVVMNERRQRVDNQPYGRAGELLFGLLYPGDHPYHWPVIGWMDDIAAATLDDVAAFFRTYYAPNNAVLTLAGDFEPEAALERIEHWFGGIPRGPAAPPVTARTEPLGGERRETLPDDVHLARVYVAYRTPPVGERLWYAADVLSLLLSSGKASLLYEELVYRRQIAQDVVAYVYPTELSGTLYIAATARPDVDPAELEAALTDVVEGCSNGFVCGERLRRARNQMLHQIFVQTQKVDGVADLLSEMTTLFDDPGRLATEPRRYHEVTLDDIRELVAGWLRRDERAVVTVVPREAAPPAVAAGGDAGDGAEPPGPMAGEDD